MNQDSWNGETAPLLRPVEKLFVFLFPHLSGGIVDALF